MDASRSRTQFSLRTLLIATGICALLFLWARFFVRFDILRATSHITAVASLYRDIFSDFDFQFAAAGTLVMLIWLSVWAKHPGIRRTSRLVLAFAFVLLSAFGLLAVRYGAWQ